MKPKLHFTAPYHWINDQMDLFIIKKLSYLFINISHMIINEEQCIEGHAITKILSILNIFQLLYIHLKILIEMDVFRIQQFKLMANFIFIIQLLNTLKKIQVMYTKINIRDDDSRASQALVVSSDGIHFDNVKNKKQIIPMIQEAYLGDYPSYQRSKRFGKNKMENMPWSLVVSRL